MFVTEKVPCPNTHSHCRYINGDFVVLLTVYRKDTEGKGILQCTWQGLL